MNTFALRDGDLVLAGDRYAMVSSAARVQQSLGLCLREPIGADRFHQEWGSNMPEWIGRVIDPGIQDDVATEITRVVNSFIARQNDLILRRTNDGRQAPLSAEEMIAGIADMSFRQDQDALLVRVILRTMGTRTLSIITSPEGAA